MKHIRDILQSNPRKPTATSTALFYCFKRRGVPGLLLKSYTDRYSFEYLARKYWYMEYKIEQGTLHSPVAWIKNNIENQHPESEMFWEWFKKKRETIMNGEFDEHLKIIASLV